MKKFLIIFLIISMPVFAGFVGPVNTGKTTNISALNQFADDTVVTLEGYLIKKLTDDEYIFKDNTGEIEVEIDEKDFRGLTITPKDKIKITGELDKDFNSISIDVDYLEIVK